jgi:hypothetical protein
VILALVASTSRVSPQTSQSSCCHAEASIRPNSTQLEVTVKNLEEAKVHAVRTGVEFDLRILIRAADGREPERTELGKRLLTTRYRGSVHAATLDKGKTWKDTLDLRTLYVLKSGAYALTVFRDVYIGEKKLELQANTTFRAP